MKGAKVAVIEARELGGVCLNRGCIPSKALIASATEYYKMKHADQYGIKLATPPVYDWVEMRKRKDTVVKTMTSGVGMLFKSHGVTHYQGYGRLVNKNEVVVFHDDGKETRLKAEHIILATGSRAFSLPAFPVDGHRIVTSDHLLELPNLPKSMFIIGGGVIGCEWASMLSMLDVDVTVVELMDKLLPLEDASSAQILERELKKQGVKIFTKTKVEGLTPGPDGVSAKLSNGEVINTNQVLVSVGRAFNTEDLGLSDAGVETNKNGSIKSGTDMRTNIKNIYSIGDVKGEILLAYTATYEGSVAVDNALGEKRTANYAGWPSVIFTHPEVASVGLTEKAAAEKHDLIIGKYPLRALGKAQAEGEIAGEAKVIGDKKTDKVLGVHVTGAHATEVIHSAAVAMRQGLTVKQFGDVIFAHPVIAESVMEALHDAHGASVHLGKKRAAH
jgi:dihydrolipoamide dehydrogenase